MCVAPWERGLVELLDQHPDIDRRAAAERPGAADQDLGVRGLDPAEQARGVRAEQPGAGDRAGRGAVDRVQGGHQAALVQLQGHARGDDAAHPAALDGQRHPQAVAVRPAARARPGRQHP
jgi:hypothetical protein